MTKKKRKPKKPATNVGVIGTLVWLGKLSLSDKQQTNWWIRQDSKSHSKPKRKKR